MQTSLAPSKYRASFSPETIASSAESSTTSSVPGANTKDATALVVSLGQWTLKTMIRKAGK